MESLPTILFRVAAQAFDEMSDIQFLAIKEFEGKLRKDEGFLSATGDLATLTATSGKDMYIGRAKITYFNNSGTPINVSAGCEVVLKINGAVVETTNFSELVNTSGGGGALGTRPYEFKNTSHKVAATEIIKLEVISLDAQIDVEGFIECWEEATGISPQIPPLSPV